MTHEDGDATEARGQSLEHDAASSNPAPRPRRPRTMNYHHQYNRDAAHQQQNQYGQLASHQNAQAAAGSSDGSYAQYGASYPHYPQDARTGGQTQASGTLHMQQAAYSQPAYGQYYGAVPAAAPRQTAPQQAPSPLQHHAAPPSMNAYQQQTYQYPSQQIHQRYAPAPAQSDGAMNANAGIGRSSAGHSGALHGLLNDDGGSWPDVAASGASTTWNQPAASSQGYSMQVGNASHAAVSMPVEAYGTAQTTYSPQIAVQPGPRMAEQPQASRTQPAQYHDMHAQYQSAQTSQYQTAQSSPYQTQSSQYQPAQSSQYPTTQSSQYHTAQGFSISKRTAFSDAAAAEPAYDCPRAASANHITASAVPKHTNSTIPGRKAFAVSKHTVSAVSRCTASAISGPVGAVPRRAANADESLLSVS